MCLPFQAMSAVHGWLYPGGSTAFSFFPKSCPGGICLSGSGEAVQITPAPSPGFLPVKPVLHPGKIKELQRKPQ